MLSRQSIAVGLLQATNSGLAAVNVILTAIVLRPEAYGQYVYLVTVSSVVPLLAGLGMEHLLLMEASRERSLTWSYFSHALLVRLVMSLVILAVILLLGWHFFADRFVSISLINAGLLLSAFPSALFLALYRIQGRHVRPWLMTFAGPIGFLIYITWPHGNMLSLERVAWAFFLSNVVVLTLFGLDMLRFARLEWEFARIPRDVGRSVVFSVSQAFDYAFARIDIVLVKILSGAFAVGTYAVGQRIVSLLQLLPSSFHIVELPEFHRASTEPLRLTARFLSLRRLLLELGLLFFGILIINSRSIVQLLFGDDYESAAVVVAVLSVAGVVMFVNYPYYMLAEAMRRLKERLVIRMITFAVTTALVSGGTWIADGLGAAIGMVGGQFFFMVLLHRLTATLNGGVSASRNEMAIVLFSAVGGIVSSVVYIVRDPSWWVSLLATIPYLVAWTYGTWRREGSPTLALIASGLAGASRAFRSR